MAQDSDDQATPPGGAPPGPITARGERERRPLDAAARARIGRGLRLHYAALLSEPVPERLRDLLDAFAARTDRESPQ